MSILIICGINSVASVGLYQQQISIRSYDMKRRIYRMWRLCKWNFFHSC